MVSQAERNRDEPGVILCIAAELESFSGEERLRDAETEALIRKITEEDPRYWARLADRIIAETKAEGGSIPMEELLGLPTSEERP